MEQLIFFVLGVVTVLLITGVVVTLRTQRKNEQLAEELKNLDYLSQHEVEALNRKIEELDQIFNSKLEREIDVVNRNFDEVHRTIDSRTDKLTTKFENNLRDIHEIVAEVKNKLN